MKIYIAAPLFCDAERRFNERIDAILQECGHKTFLPQRDGGCVAYKTDARCFIGGYDNVMLHGAPEIVLRNEEELRYFFTKNK